MNKNNALIDSLKAAPLLVSDLPEAVSFDRELFANTTSAVELNYNQKLGYLYETALEHLIISSPNIELIAKNLQIFDENKRTIGELDYILRDKRCDLNIHLELAVKFYLALETRKGWQYPGPDCRDNWHRKLKRLRSHQLAMLTNKDTQRLLAERFDIYEIITQQLIYGCIFTPWNCEQKAQPEFVSAQSRQGRWLYIHQWKEAFKGDEKIFMIPKVFWPVQITSDTLPLFDAISVQDLKNLAQNQCVMFTFEGDLTPWFLVSDCWAENIK